MLPLIQCLHDVLLALSFVGDVLNDADQMYCYNGWDSDRVCVEMYTSRNTVVVEVRRAGQPKQALTMYRSYFADDREEYIRRLTNLLRKAGYGPAIRQHRLKILAALTDDAGNQGVTA